jgi:glycosyltransferase involved in cell wall biosynthesis
MPVKISVVIPTYCRPSLLQKCLIALSDQRFNKHQFEVIVVSDGPDNETRELVQHYFRESDLVIRYFFLDKKLVPQQPVTLAGKEPRAYWLLYR